MKKIKITTKPVSYEEVARMFECIIGKKDKKDCCIFKPELIVEEIESNRIFSKPRFEHKIQI